MSQMTRGFSLRYLLLTCRRRALCHTAYVFLLGTSRHARMLVAALTVVIAGCGSSTQNPPGKTVTVSFVDGTPVAAAVRIGSAAFATAPVKNGQVTLTLPEGTARYGIAYVCPPPAVEIIASIHEFVIEATVDDGLAFTLSCSAPVLQDKATVTGTVDASGIPDATALQLNVKGFSTTVPLSGPFNTSLPVGTSDLAVVALDGLSHVLAVKIVRAQAVPGAINGGNTIVLGPGDRTTLQPITLNNVPAGFTPFTSVDFHTATGTSIFMLNLDSSIAYAALPASAVQAGDFYFFNNGAIDTAGQTLAGTLLTSTSGGGPITFIIPPPESFPGPTPAPFPTFTFGPIGNGIQESAVQAQINWGFSNTSNHITVTATGTSQNGAATLTVPNLSSLPGFLARPLPGTGVFWTARKYDGSVHNFVLSATMPPNGSVVLTQNQGSYVVP
jgi:hypothetical protein